MLFLCLLLVGVPASVLGAGTTPNLEEIFIGRCWEYQHVVNPEPFAAGKKNCTYLWDTFKGGFANRSPCAVPLDNFAEYREAAAHDTPPNEHLFWENVYPFAIEFADNGKRYLTVDGTLSGYLLDGLLWCGQETDPGINYANCPNTAQCVGQGGGDSAEDALWKAISFTFADKAEGSVYVMFNGSHGEAYRNDSVFAEYEFVNLTPDKGVHDLTLYVVHDLGKPALESCGESTLLTFEKDVQRNGLSFSCENDPMHVRMYQCVDDVTAEECVELQTSGSDRPRLTWWFVCLCAGILMAVGS